MCIEMLSWDVYAWVFAQAHTVRRLMKCSISRFRTKDAIARALYGEIRTTRCG